MCGAPDLLLAPYSAEAAREEAQLAQTVGRCSIGLTQSPECVIPAWHREGGHSGSEHRERNLCSKEIQADGGQVLFDRHICDPMRGPKQEA